MTHLPLKDYGAYWGNPQFTGTSKRQAWIWEGRHSAEIHRERASAPFWSWKTARTREGTFAYGKRKKSPPPFGATGAKSKKLLWTVGLSSSSMPFNFTPDPDVELLTHGLKGRLLHVNRQIPPIPPKMDLSPEGNTHN